MSDPGSSDVEVALCGCPYRVQRPEPWTVIFTDAEPFAGQPGRLVFTRTRGTVWYVEWLPPAFGGRPGARFIAEAYRWCTKNVGDDFAKEESS